MDGKFGIVSVIKDIVKYSSYGKLKTTFFQEGGNSISYVMFLYHEMEWM